MFGGNVGRRNYHHLMLTRVSQQQTKCPIRGQILKVLLCNFHRETKMKGKIVPRRTLPLFLPLHKTAQNGRELFKIKLRMKTQL